ncbi:hypothetical protein [Nocardia sp. NPDC047648]
MAWDGSGAGFENRGAAAVLSVPDAVGRDPLEKLVIVPNRSGDH